MKPTVPEVLPEFRAYHSQNPVWGSLHCVLDDGNFENSAVEWCRDYAIERGDADGAALAETLMRMSRTQRRKLAAIA